MSAKDPESKAVFGRPVQVWAIKFPNEFSDFAIISLEIKIIFPNQKISEIACLLRLWHVPQG
jgi:hypothetical protein